MTNDDKCITPRIVKEVDLMCLHDVHENDSDGEQKVIIYMFEFKNTREQAKHTFLGLFLS